MTRHELSRRKYLRRNRFRKPARISVRSLRFEALEDRRLLAGDLLLPFAEGEAPDPLISIRLEAADPITLRPLDSVHQGTEFLLLAHVQDRREDAKGVFAAYFDVNYPAGSFEATPFFDESFYFDNGFRNGKSGDLSQAGLVDEFGAFSSASGKPGADEQRLGGIYLTATRTGEVTITTDSPDALPFHEPLLFDADDSIPLELLGHAELTLNVLEPLPDKLVDAGNDAFAVLEDSEENLLDVLPNDVNHTDQSLEITGIETTDTRGEVTIASDGQFLVYTPEPGFVGEDELRYTVSADGEQDSATVIVSVERAESNERLVAFSYEITNDEGLLTSAVTVGERFHLNVLVEDLRDLPEGVFAGYLDVQYTSSAARVAGPISYARAYVNGTAGDTTTPGLLDELGAFSNVDPLGGGRTRILSVPFEATAVGRVIVGGNPADVVPEGAILLYGIDDPVPVDQVHFGRTAIDVLPGVVAVDDSYHLPMNTVSHLSVIDNDVSRGLGTIAIESVSAGGILGEVAVVENGTAISYTPPQSFGGSEQFTYTLRGPVGTDTATVTVHLDPAATFDDVASIELEVTDLDGVPIDSVSAGDQFLLNGFVQDLRPAGTDRGVFAAYVDVLYDFENVRPVMEGAKPRVDFNAAYPNGISINGSTPGLLDDLGAFQSDMGPLGSDRLRLFSSVFRAAPSQGQPDSFDLLEDEQMTLDVLSNDRPNEGVATFRADPADTDPHANVLLYEPPEPISFDQIRFADASLEITAGGDSTIVSVSATTYGGLVTISSDGQFLSYQPAANFSGVDRFTYSLDGETPIEVAVQVAPVSDAPVPQDDHYRGRQNQLLEVGVNRGLLANDLDADGDELRAVVRDTTEHGELTIEESGAFNYTPTDGFTGIDSFTYTVTDGEFESSPVTVELEIVANPVSIRLQPVNEQGLPLELAVADQPVRVQTLVQDLRGADHLFPGLGAAYLDIAYDPALLNPVPAPDNPLGFDIAFASFYPNGTRGEVLSEGLLDNVGAFQGEFSAAGGDEEELFTVSFDLGGPRTVDDEFSVLPGAKSTLDVLANEAAERWTISLDAQFAHDSPHSDVVFFNPADSVPAEEISFVDASFAASNGELVIREVTDSEQGGAVVIDGQSLHYTPPEGYSGPDRFTYVVADRRGRTAEATVTLEVERMWQNPVDHEDVNGDGEHSAIDALVVINYLNAIGSVELAGTPQEADFAIDVNGDGFVSPIDALRVINAIHGVAVHAEGESSPSGAVLISRTPVFARPSSATVLERTIDSPDLTHVSDDVWRKLGQPQQATLAAAEVADNELDDLFADLASDVGPLWDAL